MEYKTIDDLVAAFKENKIDEKTFREQLDALLEKEAEKAKRSVAQESVADQRIKAAAEIVRRI